MLSSEDSRNAQDDSTATVLCRRMKNNNIKCNLTWFMKAILCGKKQKFDKSVENPGIKGIGINAGLQKSLKMTIANNRPTCFISGSKVSVLKTSLPH